ncbi:hypothetical protein E1B28_007933 [Marasmius oreades]|uniref:Fungal lipase-type domain-containing protein n=1 Tax=Marasmius oreades TaxID=181124 RepID=A0A9P7S2Q4_9AGAR|nr:uncharacterized protein E1B28_007933 [Marasmius oreades]KAG7094334.1 hypothetical protein E1B28_007933 [Marasmius oreades]
MFLSFAALLSICVVVLASPTSEKRQSITILSNDQIAKFKPYTFFAAAAYCQPPTTLAWNCGAICQANPSFKPVASGGDGKAIQFWYVGYDPTLKTVIVAHQGGFKPLQAKITDFKAAQSNLNPSLFPGVPSAVQVHLGFKEEQEKTALEVLASVKKALSENSANQVTVVGHSLGGALATLDGVYLRLQLPSSTNVTVINYAAPRVGNPDFANFVDSHVPFTRITNKKDFVPTLPGQKFFSPKPFAHPNGELHINADNTWASCPGHDNPDKQCTVGSVPIFALGVLHEGVDHRGPYDGVRIAADGACKSP